MTDKSLFTSDSFSFSRVAALFAFYFPTLRKQLFIYLTVSILYSALLLIPVSDEMRVGFYSFFWTVIYWMWYLAPISIVGKGRMGTIDRLLPTKASEKLTFLLLWYVVVIPLSLILLPLCVEYLVYPTLGTDYQKFKAFLHLRLQTSWMMMAITYLGNICASLGCLYAVLKARHNKILFGILSAVGVQIVLGIIGAIYSGYELTAKAFKQGFNDGLAGKPKLDDMELVQMTFDLIQPSPATFVVLGIIIIGMSYLVWLCYRKLRKPSL